jgi:hypothetical protein
MPPMQYHVGLLPSLWFCGKNYRHARATFGIDT